MLRQVRAAAGGSLHSDLGRVWGGLSAVPVLSCQGLQDSNYVCSCKRQTHTDMQKRYIPECKQGLENFREIALTAYNCTPLLK